MQATVRLVVVQNALFAWPLSIIHLPGHCQSYICLATIDHTFAWPLSIIHLPGHCQSYICLATVNHTFLISQRQQLNLEPNTPGVGCFRLGTIEHELLHTLGFYHQQSATERDEYVTIHWDNIQTGNATCLHV
jgi:hypothetical protein